MIIWFLWIPIYHNLVIHSYMIWCRVSFIIWGMWASGEFLKWFAPTNITFTNQRAGEPSFGCLSRLNITQIYQSNMWFPVNFLSPASSIDFSDKKYTWKLGIDGHRGIEDFKIFRKIACESRKMIRLKRKVLCILFSPIDVWYVWCILMVFRQIFR